MIGADRALLERDPDLPVLGIVLDPSRLDEVVRTAFPGADPTGIEVHRIRYKPGTSLLAAVLVTTGVGPPSWIRVAGYRRGDRAKFDKDVGTALAVGGPLAASAAGGWSAVAPWADRHLSERGRTALSRAWRPIAYNPARRLVATRRTTAGENLVAKVYAPGRSRIEPAFSRALVDAGAPVPTITERARGALAVAAWIDGEPARPDLDGDAVAVAVDRLCRAAARVGTGRSVGAAAGRRSEAHDDLARRVRLALTFTASVLPDLSAATQRIADGVAQALAADTDRPAAFVHGDLSPDQVVIGPGGDAVILDLDDLGTGPHGWDRATWIAAQVAAGSTRPVALPGGFPSDPVLAAALALRSPEPFQRRRPRWDHLTATMIERAAGLVSEATPPRRRPAAAR